MGTNRKSQQRNRRFQEEAKEISRTEKWSKKKKE